MTLDDIPIQQKLFRMTESSLHLFANSNIAPPEYDFKKM